MSFSYPNAAKGLKWMFIAEILAIVSVPLMFVVIGGITAIVGMVLMLVGLYTAARDDGNYRTAFYAEIAGLVIGVVSSFAGSGLIGTLLSIVSTIVNLFIVYQVIATTCNLLTGRNEILVQRGGNVIKIYLVCIVVSLVCSVLSIIPILDMIAAVVRMVASIAQLVGYILYLMFLYGASKALA